MNSIISGIAILTVSSHYAFWALCTLSYFRETQKLGKRYKRFLFAIGGAFFLISGVAMAMHLYLFSDPADYDSSLILIYTIVSLALYMILMYGLTRVALARQEEDPREEFYRRIAGSLATIFALVMLAVLLSVPFLGLPIIVHAFSPA